jgi:hypothetical protein
MLTSVRNTCQIVAGRLLEIDVCAGYRSVQDVDEMMAMMKAQVARVPEPTRIVIAADWRACSILTPEVSERAVQMLVRSNPRVERSTILHGAGQSTSVLQVLRIAREAELATRRVFTDALEMERWLGEVLTPEEQARLHLLLHKASARD